MMALIQSRIYGPQGGTGIYSTVYHCVLLQFVDIKKITIFEINPIYRSPIKCRFSHYLHISDIFKAY